jgi:hypothetical protein
LGVGLSIKLVSNNNIRGEKDLFAKVLSLLEDLLGGLNVIILKGTFLR